MLRREHVAVNLTDVDVKEESGDLLQRESQPSCWGTLMTLFADFPKEYGGFTEDTSPRKKCE